MSPASAGQIWYAAVFPDWSQPAPPSVWQRLCIVAQRFTSFVSVEMPNALLLEIKGSVKLFGSLPVLHAAIDAAWSHASHRACAAVAPTTVAALWLARAGQAKCIDDPRLLAGQLAPLPISCTAWDASRLQTLRGMGVMRIGELLRLPRAGVARRLGSDALCDIDIALARQAAPRRAFVARERFRERCDFDAEIETTVYLQKALEPLVERCARFLRERQAGLQVLQLRLRHRALPPTRVRFGLAGVTSERSRLQDVMTQKLNRLELAAPVRGMELVSGPLQPLSGESLDAFAGSYGGRDTAPQLVERLRARLGENAVYGVRPVAEHRPEAAWRRVHDIPVAATARLRSVPAERADMPRPVWLLDEPVLLSPDLSLLGRQGVVLCAGPERIESGWWDGKGVTRDYYVARQLHGARWWVFQERKTKGWYLHGVFA